MPASSSVSTLLHCDLEACGRCSGTMMNVVAAKCTRRTLIKVNYFLLRNLPMAEVDSLKNILPESDEHLNRATNSPSRRLDLT